MPKNSIENRITALENELERLKKKVDVDPRPWWEQIFGRFANDPMYEEAMRLGREYRESLRPKTAARPRPGNRRGKKPNGRP